MWLLTLGYYVLLCILGLAALLAAGWALYRMRGFFLGTAIMMSPLFVGIWMQSLGLTLAGGIIILTYVSLMFLAPFIAAIKDYCAFKRAHKSTTPTGEPE